MLSSFESSSSSIQGFSEIIHLYDVYIFDLWGVIHNGTVPFPRVIETLRFLKENGKIVLFLSNAPRIISSARVRLLMMGITDDLYHGLWTSGEECHHFLKEHLISHDYASSFGWMGTKMYHVGFDSNVYETLAYQEVSSLDMCDFILVTGYNNLSDSTFKEVIALDKPLVCANYDRVVMMNEKKVFCAGQMALQYENLGGRVFYHGKPNLSMYKKVHGIASSFLETPPQKKRILMIGDSLQTDIAGANSYGIDSLLVQTGVHGQQKIEGEVSSFDHIVHAPTYVCSEVRIKP